MTNKSDLDLKGRQQVSLLASVLGIVILEKELRNGWGGFS